MMLTNAQDDICYTVWKHEMNWTSMCKIEVLQNSWICKKNKCRFIDDMFPVAPTRAAFHVTDHCTSWAISSGLPRLSFWFPHSSDSHFFFSFFTYSFHHLLFLNDKPPRKSRSCKYVTSHDYNCCLGSDDKSLCINPQSFISPSSFLSF